MFELFRAVKTFASGSTFVEEGVDFTSYAVNGLHETVDECYVSGRSNSFSTSIYLQVFIIYSGGERRAYQIFQDKYELIAAATVGENRLQNVLFDIITRNTPLKEYYG